MPTSELAWIAVSATNSPAEVSEGLLIAAPVSITLLAPAVIASAVFPIRLVNSLAASDPALVRPVRLASANGLG